MDDTAKLVNRVLVGDSEAWRELQATVEPTILSIARRHHGLRRKGLATLPDDLAEVRTAALERLARSDFNNLRSFVERQSAAESGPPPSFDSWLYGVVDFVVREHLRRRFGRAPKPALDPEAGRPPSKRDMQSNAGRFDEELSRALLNTVSVTTRLTLAEVLAYIEKDFTPLEAQAVRLYFQEDQSFEAIATQLGLGDAKLAERLIRRLNARLRYRFLNQGVERAGADQ